MKLLKYILDTNIYIEIERNNQSIKKKIESYLKKKNGLLYLTSPTYTELFYGFLKRNPKDIKKKLEKLNSLPVLNTSKRSALMCADLKHNLEKKGKIIPIFDLFIASIVIANKGILITSDPHFKEIGKIRLIYL
ncbi:PIN domain-containing protein [Candidatus Woesearchaeota archaeon]|nr:PIN domain-containing protein [Candidatus Woesearchaeota archaeon]